MTTFRPIPPTDPAWSVEAVRAAIRDWTDTYGRPPSYHEWTPSRTHPGDWEAQSPRWPSAAAVCRAYDDYLSQWTAALADADAPDHQALLERHRRTRGARDLLGAHRPPPDTSRSRRRGLARPERPNAATTLRRPRASLEVARTGADLTGRHATRGSMTSRGSFALSKRRSPRHLAQIAWWFGTHHCGA